MKTRFLCLCLFSSVLVSSALCAESWEGYQHDSSHTGRSTVRFDPANLKLAWTSPEGYYEPFVSGDMVIATKASTITAFDLRSGAQKWSYNTKARFPGRAAIGEGFVVVPGEELRGNNDSAFVGLYVLSADTGEFKYKLELPNSRPHNLPIIHREPNGEVRAYYPWASVGGTLAAVRLQDDSGEVLWTGRGNFGSSFATIGGESIFVSGVSQLYAFNRETGQRNEYFNGGYTGGGGATASFDENLSRLYVGGLVSGNPSDALLAFDYTDNSTIVERWRYSGVAQQGPSGGVAITDEGLVVSMNRNSIAVLDPDDGSIRKINQNVRLSTANAPIVSDGYIWAGGDTQTFVFDENTLMQVQAVRGSRGNENTPFDSPGALFRSSDGRFAGFITNEGPGSSTQFRVYAVPESHNLLLALTAFTALPWSSGRKRRN